MIFRRLTPKQSLNKGFLKHRVLRQEINVFKSNLALLLSKIDEIEREENQKNHIRDFLLNTYYKETNEINTKDSKDLVIHLGKSNKDKVGVIIEAKRPSNRNEMFSFDRPNCKALGEIILYYFSERIKFDNNELKHLIITNIYEWIIFDANDFDKHIFRNSRISKLYHTFVQDGKETQFFYEEVRKIIEETDCEISCSYFNIQDYKLLLLSSDPADDNKLIALHKIFSPEHLLKLPFANDNNSLDKNFYAELLHIIGLTEVKEGNKKLIQRNKPSDRHSGSLLENAINQIEALDKLSRIENPKQYGDNTEEQLFGVALELCITWINRILFLKLLEAQLVSYHKGNKDYEFLNHNKIKNYDDINTMFFQVLARKHHNRSEEITSHFSNIPYLNSSLFELTELEHTAINISNLRVELSIPLHSNTQIKDLHGQKRTGKMNTLVYLFEFLNAYNFASEGTDEIQEESKTLINASVLGLIFEKINGYKDGSFFTPGFITMYMCREAIRKAVVQKFNEVKGCKCDSLDDLYDKIEDRNEANNIINSIRICDPAVGSGHFLVSSLNEILAIKSDLKILQDRTGRRLKEYFVEVENDELIVIDENGEFFKYNPKSRESQRVQETLFHEKQTIIENCLFGVDINPNSVKICSLRLWIELLKNAYYKSDNELETLPNIDINIKCGNSLISRFNLKDEFNYSDLRVLEEYKIAVAAYKNVTNRQDKSEISKVIEKCKNKFQGMWEGYKSADELKLNQLTSKLQYLISLNGAFEDEEELTKREIVKEKLKKQIEELMLKVDEAIKKPMFRNAFEWRFEFPEVLDESGNFIGFDVVIGNPPYIEHKKLAHISNYLKEKYEVYYSSADISSYFYELGINILKSNSYISLISTNKYFRTEYGKPLRKFLSNFRVHTIVNFEQVSIFDEALVSSLIIIFEKNNEQTNFTYSEFCKESAPSKDTIKLIHERNKLIKAGFLNETTWSFSGNSISKLIEKLYSIGKKIKDIDSIDIKRGVTTGYDPAFIITDNIANEINNKKIIKPLIKGAHIKKYRIAKSNLNLIFTRRGYNIESDKKIKEHLIGFYDELKPKESGESTGRKPGDYKWFEIQDNIAYYKNFNSLKIVWPLTADRWGFALDKDKHYLSSGGFLLVSDKFDLKYILAILNSKLMEFLFSEIGVMTAGGAYTLKKSTIEEFPIIDKLEAQQPFIDLVDRILSKKLRNKDTSHEEREIDMLVYKLYELTEEEIAVVEGRS